MNFEFQMWKEGRKQLLDVVVARLPRGLQWRLCWFDGVVHPSYGDAPAINSPVEFLMSDADLLRLAAFIEDLDSIVLCADGADGSLAVECEDSSRWSIRGTGSWASLVEAAFEDLRG